MSQLFITQNLVSVHRNKNVFAQGFPIYRFLISSIHGWIQLWVQYINKSRHVCACILHRYHLLIGYWTFRLRKHCHFHEWPGVFSLLFAPASWRENFDIMPENLDSSKTSFLPYSRATKFIRPRGERPEKQWDSTHSTSPLCGVFNINSFSQKPWGHLVFPTDTRRAV
jgi:hypothetical protein